MCERERKREIECACGGVPERIGALKSLIVSGFEPGLPVGQASALSIALCPKPFALGLIVQQNLKNVDQTHPAMATQTKKKDLIPLNFLSEKGFTERMLKFFFRELQEAASFGPTTPKAKLRLEPEP